MSFPRIINVSSFGVIALNRLAFYIKYNWFRDGFLIPRVAICSLLSLVFYNIIILTSTVAMAILGGYAGLILIFKIKSAISGGGKKIEA